MFQNLARKVDCTLRIGLATLGSPNWALVTVVFQLGKVTWLMAFAESPANQE